MIPSYIKTYNSGRLKEIADQAMNLLASCVICPRKCKVNRLKDEKGFCKTGALPIVFSHMAHHGEEPPISGSRGSGTIFFSHCNMACLYCQNYEFSQKGGGKESTPEELAAIMIELQDSGCHNINFVTPTHVMPQILKALLIAIPKGLHIPLVYNTSGYELPEMIKMLEGIFDIYLPDLRYADEKYALQYSAAPDYPACSQNSVKEMHRQAGVAQFDKYGIIEKGVIIRRLVLPDNIAGTEKIMKFIAEELSKDTYISLMSQYTPYYKAKDDAKLSRRLSFEEYEKAQQSMQSYGLHNGWVQESFGLQRFAGVHIKPTHADSKKE